MECPKCAAVQADGGVECTVCGVVFDRYREAQERATLLRRASPEPIESGSSIPRGAIIVAVIVFLAFGLFWTAKRRDSRANANQAATAMLDEINMKGIKQRQRLAAEGERARRASYEAQVAQAPPPSRPIGLSEESAAEIVNQCSGFNTYEQVLLPKSYTDYDRSRLDELYPALAIARRDKVVEVKAEQGQWKVIVPDVAHFRMTIKEDQHHHIIPLGRRRITAIRDLTGTADSAEARFEFTFEQRVAGELLVQPYTNFFGRVTFVRKNNVWRALDATTYSPDTHEVDQSNLCK